MLSTQTRILPRHPQSSTVSSQPCHLAAFLPLQPDTPLVSFACCAALLLPGRTVGIPGTYALVGTDARPALTESCDSWSQCAQYSLAHGHVWLHSVRHGGISRQMPGILGCVSRSSAATSHSPICSSAFTWCRMRRTREVA